MLSNHLKLTVRVAAVVISLTQPVLADLRADLPTLKCEVWSKGAPVVLDGTPNSSDTVITYSGAVDQYKFRVIYSREGNYFLPKISDELAGMNASSEALTPHSKGKRLAQLSLSERTSQASLSCALEK